jgi:hypothetical protein
MCPSNRTTKTTDKPVDEEELRTENAGLAKVAGPRTATTFTKPKKVGCYYQRQ